MKPLAPERYKIQFTVDREAHDKLRRAQDLLRHTIPDGDLAAIFDKAITLLLEDLARAKHGAAGRPRSSRPPAATGEACTAHTCCDAARGVATRWRAVRLCRQPGPCTEQGFLEFHHLVPYAVGGEATIANLELRCRAHNADQAERYFGPRRARLPPDEPRGPAWSL